MSQSKRIPPARVLPFKGGGGQLSDHGNKAIRLFMTLVAENVSEEEAWAEAGMLSFRPKLQVTDPVNCPIVSRNSNGYDGQPMNGTATKPKKAKTEKSIEIPEGLFRGIRLIPGDSLEIVLSRGILRFLAQQEITIPAASEKYGIHERTLYRLVKEKDMTPGLAGSNIDRIAQHFGITRQQLLELGEPQP